jgi:molybdenum cofactor synthesis domain-containing protein
MDSIRTSVITISDRSAAGKQEDASGPLLAALAREMGAEVVSQATVPDEQEQITALLVQQSDQLQLDLILTTGGTGVTPRDVTPEATLAAIDRAMPGLAEVLRFEGYRHTPLAVISRGVAGVRGRTIIVNLPGSPKAVQEGMEVLVPILPHAVRMVRGVDTDHDAGKSHG